jgi:hypothetical protein
LTQASAYAGSFSVARSKKAAALSRPASQHLRDGMRDLVLERENALQLPLEGLRPEVHVVGHVDELRGHPQGVPLAPHAALEQRVHLQPIADLARVEVPPLERVHRSARGHPQPIDVGEGIDQLLGAGGSVRRPAAEAAPGPPKGPA